MYPALHYSLLAGAIIAWFSLGILLAVILEQEGVVFAALAAVIIVLAFATLTVLIASIL